MGLREMPVEATIRVKSHQRDSGLPNFPLLPRAAWEKVPEGRMRALFSSPIDTSDLFCYKNLPRRNADRQEEPSPGLRPPSPIASQRERGKIAEVQPIVAIFPRTALRRQEKGKMIGWQCAVESYLRHTGLADPDRPGAELVGKFARRGAERLAVALIIARRIFARSNQA